MSCLRATVGLKSVVNADMSFEVLSRNKKALCSDSNEQEADFLRQYMLAQCDFDLTAGNPAI